MKQFQIAYQNDEAFLKELEGIEVWCGKNPSYTTVFRIYSQGCDTEQVKHVCDILDEKMPNALYLGCAANANILDGELSKAKITLSCTVFEYETTKVELHQLPFSEENVKDDVRRLREYCAANSWVSAVEVHATVLGMSVREFCKEMSTLREDIQVFGGGACNPDPNNITTMVFSKGNGFSTQGIVFLLLGGKDFHTFSTYISGWKSLKRKFRVTKARGATLYKLDGEPAFNIYKKYLNINKNTNLISNTLEFPLLMNHNGIDVLRCLMQVNEDDSLVLTADVAENSDVRLAYGDPRTILDSIRRDGRKIADFQPQCIQIFSCASRKAFWGNQNISGETIFFKNIAPTSGFYTGGEFLRVNGVVSYFNITLVLAAMREGELKQSEVGKLYDETIDNIESEKIPLISRFVSFIDASTAELEELNRKLELASITDGLTGLYNRREIERRIRSTVEQHKRSKKSHNLSLIMLDIDNFKQVNDDFGHKEGDRVLVALSDVLRKTVGGKTISLGRWGGEEFMILLSDSDINEAAALAEKIRAAFAAVRYDNAGCQTVSLGVIQEKDGEDADALYIRVDKALYMAKTGGKNRVVELK